MYLVKTATFFMASLAFIAWGYRELHTAHRAEEVVESESSAGDTESPAASEAIPVAQAQAWTNPLSMIPTAKEIFKDVGLISASSPNELTSDLNSFNNSSDINDNWNLSNTELTADLVTPYFEYSEPQQIVYYTSQGMKVIQPNQVRPPSAQQGQSLFVGTADSVAQTAEERQRRADAASENPHSNQPSGAKEGPDADPNVKENSAEVALPENAFRVVYFKPGKRDSGKTLVPANPSPLSALQGPDYSFETASSDDEDSQKRVLTSVLSLGHGGELMLKVAKEGYVRNEPGFDFAVYENAFRIAGLGIIFQEFALIGVSDKPTPESFKWFDCRPEQQILRGCIGAVPTSEGGDKFDLSDVGLDRISYIWIKDTGKNKNYPSKWPTEGADLDAVRLYHAYSTQ